MPLPMRESSLEEGVFCKGLQVKLAWWMVFWFCLKGMYTVKYHKWVVGG